MECVLRDLVTENADLQSRNQTKDRELAEAQQQLREKVSARKAHFFWYIKNLCSTSIPDCRRNSYTIKRNSYNPVRGRR